MFGSLVMSWVERGELKTADHGRVEDEPHPIWRGRLQNTPNTAKFGTVKRKPDTNHRSLRGITMVDRFGSEAACETCVVTTGRGVRERLLVRFERDSRL